MCVNPERRLSAILAMDMVGFSRLVQANEEEILARQKSYRNDEIDPKITEHRGRIVKSTGDGLLAEFPSAIDAVRCAVSIQMAMTMREAETPENERIIYRAGVNLGDIVVDEGDIFGDGVNIAARLEAQAEPGGICVSRAVVDQFKGNFNFDFEEMGRRNLKNIEQPILIYRVKYDSPMSRPAVNRSPQYTKLGFRLIGASLVVAIALFVTWQIWESLKPDGYAGLPLPDRPSIAVLPFDNLSNDDSQEFLVDGFTEDVITALSKFKSIFVIARNSTFTYKGKAVKIQQVSEDLGVHYVLEGSIQKSGDILRITAQLIDGRTGNHIWAEKYDRPMNDLFAVQDDVTGRIANTISGRKGAIYQAGQDIRGMSPEKLEAYINLLHGIDLIDRFPEPDFTEQDIIQARVLLQKAIELDPENAKAYAKMALAWWVDIIRGYSSSFDQTNDMIWQYANKAIEVDPQESLGYWPLAVVHMNRRNIPAAMKAYEKALELNPNDADVRMNYAWALTTTGRVDEAADQRNRALRLNPFYPSWYLLTVSQTHFSAGEYEKASEAMKPVAHSPFYLSMLAASYSAQGRMDEARILIPKIYKLAPNYSVEKMVSTFPFNPELKARYYENLIKAGMREK